MESRQGEGVGEVTEHLLRKGMELLESCGG